MVRVQDAKVAKGLVEVLRPDEHTLELLEDRLALVYLGHVRAVLEKGLVHLTKVQRLVLDHSPVSLY